MCLACDGRLVILPMYLKYILIFLPFSMLHNLKPYPFLSHLSLENNRQLPLVAEPRRHRGMVVVLRLFANPPHHRHHHFDTTTTFESV
ncbi:hypothetical protein HanXRQr2_Chr15g0715021 [Helianthus annuus]|uniref:Uncharacterized protein n=1 Tax=Helianthus annuus TaxID=4232 RepID=A0A9K3H3T6_HELAN|nr:hypothetical protein HanXRQr2_Chr15g0715021 [Helianthus annuus]